MCTPQKRRTWLKQVFLGFASCLIVFVLVACGTSGSSGPSPTPTTPPTPVATATPFTVTGVDLTVSPQSIAQEACWSSTSFSYVATFHIPAGTRGGTIAFQYTFTNGRTFTNANVSVSPGATTSTYTFVHAGTVTPDRTFPGTARVKVTSPNLVYSPAVAPEGVCSSPAAFEVTGVDLTVSPQDIASASCGTTLTLTYTAVFHLPPDGPRGTIAFQYTFTNGRTFTSASVSVGPGETISTYRFTQTGKPTADRTFPGVAQVKVISPNVVYSPQILPTGVCSSSTAFHVISIAMSVSPQNIADFSCGTTLTVTYTATFHLQPNSAGGTIVFFYTTNNGRGTTRISLPVGAGKTIATYSFTWSGNLPADHTQPGLGGVMTTSPNEVRSPMVQPEGVCHEK